MMASINCSYDNLVVWDKIVNCVLDRDHLTGQILGVVAVPMWSSAHICQYVILRSRVKSASSTRIMTFLFTHWLSECISVVSAFLAQQWLSQIVFSLCLLLLHTVCCLHYMLAPLPTQANIVSIDKKLTVRSRSRLKTCPHILSLLFLPAVILTISKQDLFLSHSNLRAIINTSRDGTDFQIPHTVGYVFGSLAGLLYCSIVMIDMLDSYITVESGANLILTYVIRVLSECTYVSSVFVQNKTIYDHIRTSPWTIPRLVSTGLNIGVSLFPSHSLSSESETDFHSDDSEEEVIWMPLKSVQSAIPTHPVCVSRVQIISEADIPPDVTSPHEEEQTSPHDVNDCSSHEESIPNGPKQTNPDETSAVTDEDIDN